MIRPTAIAIALAVLAADAAPAKVTFEEHVKPILREQCAGCHNQDNAASGLALDAFAATLEGGAGGDVVVPGDPDGSRLWRLVNHDEEPVMPPGADKLPAEQLAVIRAWIEEGLLKDAGSKPMAAKKSAIAAVEPTSLGKPEGEPAMPVGWFREPLLTANTVGPIDALAASPWAPLVATPWQRQVSLYHAETNRLLGVAPYLEGMPRIVRFSRDGSLLLVAGGRDAAAGSATLYDVKTGARVATVGDELDAVLAADLSADNRLIALGGSNKKVRTYRVADGEVAYTCEKHTDWVTALAFSPDGKLLATGDRASGLRLWDASEGHERGDLRGHKRAITAIDWRRDGGLLASASEDSTVRLWSPDGKPIKSVNAHGSGVMSVAFAPGGRFATAGRDRFVKVWKPDGVHLADLARTPDIALAVAFSHDGSRVFASDWTGQVQAIDVEAKTRVAKLLANPPTLTERLAQAEIKLTNHEEAAATAQSKLDEALASLDEGRERHAEHDAKLADARLALNDAAKASDEALAAIEPRRQELEAASQALAQAKRAFLAAREAVNGDKEKSTDAEEAERLANALDAARGVRNEAREAVAAAKKRLAVAEENAGKLKEPRHAAEALLATLTNQTAGLPDLPGLEKKITEQRQELKKQQRRIESEQAARDALNVEIEAYKHAGEQLAAEAQAARDELAKLEKRTQQASEAHTIQTEASQRVSGTVERLREQIANLRQELSDLREKQKTVHASFTEAEEALEQSRTATTDAERRALLLESRLDDLRAAQAWRAERAASE